MVNYEVTMKCNTCKKQLFEFECISVYLSRVECVWQLSAVAWRWSSVQCSIVQYSAVQFSTVQLTLNAVQYSAVQTKLSAVAWRWSSTLAGGQQHRAAWPWPHQPRPCPSSSFLLFSVTRRSRSDYSHKLAYGLSVLRLYWCDSGEWRYISKLMTMVKVYFLKGYFLRVYFPKVYFPKVYFLKVYFPKVYFPKKNKFQKCIFRKCYIVIKVREV